LPSRGSNPGQEVKWFPKNDFGRISVDHRSPMFSSHFLIFLLQLFPKTLHLINYYKVFLYRQMIPNNFAEKTQNQLNKNTCLGFPYTTKMNLIRKTYFLKIHYNSGKKYKHEWHVYCNFSWYLFFVVIWGIIMRK
jgi:hypothetical protein